VAEWLEAQAAGGYLTYHPDGGRFSPPAEVAAVLADEAGTMLVGGFAQMLLARARLAELEAEVDDAEAAADLHRAERARWSGTPRSTSWPG
jgi:hypothetical protein